MLPQSSLVQVCKPPFCSWNLWIGNGLVLFLWLCLHRASLQWLYQALGELSPLQLLFSGLLGVGLLVQGVRWSLTGLRRSSDRQLMLQPVLQPVLRWGPLLLLAASGVAAVLLPWVLDLEQLQGMVFLLGSYGLVGLVLPAGLWTRGLPLAILLAWTVPFSLEVSVGLGFPLRMLTAHWVEQMLAQWQISALSSQDIIVLETGIARVDLPCSGLKSLWTGILFLLLATGLERRRIGLRWLGVCLLQVGLLTAANTGRVLVLVLLTQVAQQPQLGHLLHLPLGLVGFAAACTLTWVLLQTVPRNSLRPANQRSLGDANDQDPAAVALSQTPARRQPGPVSVQLGLLGGLVGLLLLPQPVPQPLAAVAPLNLPASVAHQSLALTPAEQRFFGEYPGVVATKDQFQFQGISGSFLRVASPSWRAHHAPELCLLGNGFQIDHSERRWLQAEQRSSLSPDFPSRWLSLNQGQWTAVYWFQAAHQTTDDFLVRLWQEITHREQNWVLVSLLLDQPQPAHQPAVTEFLTTLHSTVERSLNP